MVAKYLDYENRQRMRTDLWFLASSLNYRKSIIYDDNLPFNFTVRSVLLKYIYIFFSPSASITFSFYLWPLSSASRGSAIQEFLVKTLKAMFLLKRIKIFMPTRKAVRCSMNNYPICDSPF